MVFLCPRSNDWGQILFLVLSQEACISALVVCKFQKKIYQVVRMLSKVSLFLFDRG